MSYFSESTSMGPELAYEALIRFASENSEVALRLAMHSAVPQAFRPDLLHLLKLNFIPKQSADLEYADAYRTAEADVLLSPACRHIGSEFFEFDPEIRRLLLDNLVINYAEEPRSRIHSVANFLLTYADHQSASLQKNQLWRDYLEIQRWVALGFLDPNAAAEQMATVLSYLDKERQFAVHARIGGVASALSVQLTRHQPLLKYAMGLQELQEGNWDRAEEILTSLEDKTLTFGDVQLRSPTSLLEDIRTSHWTEAKDISETSVLEQELLDDSQAPISEDVIADLTQNRILVVNDNDEQRIRIVKLLRSQQFTVEEARTNAEAFDFMASYAFALVITDIVRKPERYGESGNSGVDLLHAIGNSIPTLVFSAFGEERVRRLAPNISPTGFITRQHSDQELLVAIRRIIGEQRIEAPYSNKLFISYFRQDDEPFVQRLYGDLVADGFDIWWDRVSMSNRGLTFLQEIRDAIYESDRVILVLGPAAITSEYVRSEWEYALSICKPIHSLLRSGDYAEVPEELAAYDIRDFREDTQYEVELERLKHQITAPRPPLGQLFGVPKLPANYTSRQEELDFLKRQVLSDAARPVVVSQPQISVSQGMGGIGKTVLASALARDCDVRRAFPDGILWVALGQSPNITSAMRNIGVFLGDRPDSYISQEEGHTRLQSLLEDKNALIVLDDVWEAESVRALAFENSNVRYLITTRNAEIANTFASDTVKLDGLSTEQATEMLMQAIGHEDPAIPAIIDRLGNLPLALSLAAAQLRTVMSGEEFLRRLDNQVSTEKSTLQDNLLASIELSLQQFLAEDRQLLAALTVFGEDIKITKDRIVSLWQGLRNNLSEADSIDLINKFVKASLLMRDEDNREKYSLHDLLYDVLSQQLDSEMREIAQNLIDIESQYQDRKLKAKVFISYARQDGQEFAERLRRDLEGQGFSVWMDARGIDAYQDFSAAIEQAINSADYVLVLITPDVRRADSFVRREIIFSQSLQKRIIPVKISDTLPPITIINLEYVDMLGDYDQGFQQLIDLLSEPQTTINDKPTPKGHIETETAKKSEGTQPIFISYRSHDREFALRLSEDLRKVGISTWLDTPNNLVDDDTSLPTTEDWEKAARGTDRVKYPWGDEYQADRPNISVGDNWVTAIENALSDTSGLILLINAETFTSQSEEEVRQARANGINIYPVLIGNAQPEDLPRWLAKIQLVDMRTEYEHGLQQLVSAIRSSSDIVGNEKAPNTETTQTKIFVAHSRVDQVDARMIIARLENDYDVWSDRRLDPGQDWWQEILERIRKCDVLLYFITAESLESQYCQAELQEAMRLQKTVIPIMIRRTDISKDANLAGIAYIDATFGWNEQVEGRLRIALERIEDQTLTASKPIIQEKQTPEPIPTSNSPSNLLRTSIALFGPVASGKTTLIQAFVRSIQDLDQSISSGLMKHRLQAANERSYDFIGRSLDRLPVATLPHMDHIVLNFRREPTDPNDSRQTVSSFQHEISLLDSGGSLYVEGIDGSVVSLQQLRSTLRDEEYDSWQILAGCSGIIVLLDPTLLATTEAEKGSSKLSAAEYTRLLQRLTWLSPKSEDGSDRRIAICISKVDILGEVSTVNSEQLVEKVFGTSVTVAVNQLKTHFGDGFVRTFAVSALGYYQIPSGEKRPNLISGPSEGTRIIDSERWSPYRVHEPFLWLLQGIELDEIERRSPTGLSRLIRRDKREQYIPYLNLDE